MKKPILLAIAAIAGVGAYLYFKNKKNNDASVIEEKKDSISALNNPESNEPTQVFGTSLPDGTKATGASNITQSPVDVISKPTASNSNLAIPSASNSWEADNFIKANELYQNILSDIIKMSKYKKAASKRNVQAEIDSLTNQITTLGYKIDEDTKTVVKI